MKQERPYDFKKELLQIHKKNARDFSRQPEENEFQIPDGISIVLPEEENVVVTTAAKDFIDYLFVSMEISALITRKSPGDKASIRLTISQDVGEAAQGYMGYSVSVDEKGISVTGYDDVGVAQGLYFLEDLMNLRKAPFLTYGLTERKSLFETRSAHSPFGMFEYPDEAFAMMAHRGYNTIGLWLKDAYTTHRGDFIDVNFLCERAARYGIRVTAELYTLHKMHPDDEGAQEFYDNIYGTLVQNCPKLAGISLVGEANQFQSRDPRVGKTPFTANYEENIPTGRISPGWWPCRDFPDLVKMVQNSIHKVNPNVELTVCSYNWGYAPEEDRLALIDAMPDGITFVATWDMFHKYRRGEAVFHIADYTLKFAGPGEYFASEAIAAKKRGIKLATISNTAGRTWDFGVIPYEPMATRWIERYEKIQKAHREWNLMGMVESIHYSFYPSIIGDLEKWAFFSPCKPLSEVLNDLLVRDFGEDAERAGKAMDCFSRAIDHYPTTDDDQYGAFRIGPSYPFWVKKPLSDGKRPDQRRAMFGNSIYNAMYEVNGAGPGVEALNSMPGVRIYEEIKSVQKMRDLIAEGIGILESCPNPNDALLRLLNLSRFMYRTTLSGLHIKELYILRRKLDLAGTTAEVADLLVEIEALLLKERKNAEDTIPLVQVDSRLGWEPSMEYTTDEAALRWKLRQVDYELNHTLAMYRKSNGLIKQGYHEE